MSSSSLHHQKAELHDRPAPLGDFGRFPLDASIQRGIAGLGFIEPRPIQVLAIPPALEGRDVLGLAQTGTGKTAAFVLPILQRLGTGRRPLPRALILAPTRELATQIQVETDKLARFTGLKSVAIFGGVPAGRQVRALRERPDIVVACPGRLLDLMQQGLVNLSAIEVLVLDEADHMFDLGFLPNVRRILEALPKKRQNLLFSATMPKEVRGLTTQILSEPRVIELAHSKPAETIEQTVCRVPSHRKLDLLRHFLAEDGFTSAIVFLRTKHRARRLAQQLSRLGHDAVALEGNMSQSQRDHAMNGFRGGRFDVLVATDIAARGIDVANVSHVINFDVPNTPDAYTHRIGRTGRAERRGRAITLMGDEDHGAIRDIERKLGAPLARLHPAGFDLGQGADPGPERQPQSRAQKHFEPQGAHQPFQRQRRHSRPAFGRGRRSGFESRA
ncbi:MAG TPA: DEAD/DEAH box helicase [Candidatus Acidoferrales bacterium]|nr:DEAD/DEAH box helicase [Candidatus Acidoferrales bacterium]